MANKYTAQLLEDFASTKKDGSNRHEVRWKDYEKIQNMKRQDVTDSKKFINDELERISKLQGKPDGTLYTDAEKQEMKKEWEHLKASIEGLEKSWQMGIAQIERHKEENYEPVVPKTKEKLKELFGDVKQIAEPLPQASQRPTENKDIAADIEFFRGMKYSFDGTPFEFKELKFENNRYLLTLKSVDKKDVSFFLEKKVDGKFEAAGPTKELYKLVISPSDKTVVITTLGKDTLNPPVVTAPPIPQQGPTEKLDDGESAYNEAFYKKNKKRFDTVHDKAPQGKLFDKLDAYISDRSKQNGKALQEEINKQGASLTPDGLVGPVTLTGIEKILGITPEGGETPAVTPQRGGTRRRTGSPAGEAPGKPGETLNEKSKTEPGIGFTHEAGKIVLNARDEAGSVKQKYTYDQLKALAGNTKLSETAQGELKQLVLYSTIADLWIQAASNDMNDLTAGWIRDGDKKQYTQSIDSLRKKIQGIQDALLSGKSVQASLFELYSEMDRLNTNTGRFSPPINVNDLRKALTIVQAPGGLSMDQRRAEILNTLSSVFNKSLTAGVKDTAMVEVLKRNEMKGLTASLNNAEFMNALISGDSREWPAKLKSQLNISDASALSISRELRDIRKGIESRKDQMRAGLTAQGVTDSNVIDAQIQGAIKYSLQMGLSKFIIDSKLPEMQGIYVDAYRTASQDLTTNKIIDTAAQLAISLVPLGGGLLTMRAAGAVGARVLPKLAGSSSLTLRGARAVGGGVAFYEGFNLTNNLLQKQEMNGIGDAFEGWDDTKEIAKNIIMIGVIRGMGLIPGQKITPAFMKNPAKMNQFALETLKVAGIAGGVTAASQGVEMLFGGEFQPTPEEFMQAVIMTALFRKFGSVNKGPRQDVRNLPENIEKFLVRDITAKHVRSQRTVMKHDKNVFPQYIGADGSVWNIRAIRGSNGKEVIETGKQGSPEVKQIPIDDFVKMVNTNIAYWQGQMRRIVATQPAAQVSTNPPEVIPSAPANTPALKNKPKALKPATAVDVNIGSKLSKNIDEILGEVKTKGLTQGDKQVISYLKAEMISYLKAETKNSSTMGGKELKDLRDKLNQKEGELFMNAKVKETSASVKVWDDIMAQLYKMIIAKAPKYSFPNLESARKWVQENPKKVAMGALIIISGTAYFLVHNDKGEIITTIVESDRGTNIGEAADRVADVPDDREVSVDDDKSADVN